MATCALASAFALDCKNSKGGIKKIYFAVFADGAYSPTVVSGLITAWSGAAAKFYTYNVRQGVATGGDKQTISKTNGTTFNAPTLTLQLEKMSSGSSQELINLAATRLLAIALDRNGKYWLMGYNNGVDVTEISGEFGTAMGDFNGYKITVMGEEETPMYEVSSGIVSALIAA